MHNASVSVEQQQHGQSSGMLSRRHRRYSDAIGFALAYAVVFAIPWGDMVQLSYDVQASRVLTVAVAAFLAISLWRNGSLRPLNACHWWMICFALWAASAVAWTPEPERSLRRILSYYQLFCCVWLVHQTSSSIEKHYRLLSAYVLGCYVVFAGLLYNFVRDVYQGDGRYTAPGFDPNDLAVTLILAIPVAWYLSIRMRAWQWLHRLYIPCAILAALLTASRGGLVTLGVVLIFPLLSIPKSSIKALASLALLTAVSGFTVAAFMSDISIRRLSTITEQLANRDLNGRVNIWERGLEAFAEHPLAGAGAGTFANAIGSRRSRDIAAHNSLLGVLVEHGLTGVCFFLGIILSLYRRAWRGPSVECRLWAVLLTAWCVAASTLSWENRELTWLIWGLCAGQPLLRRINKRKPQWSQNAFFSSAA